MVRRLIEISIVIAFIMIGTLLVVVDPLDVYAGRVPPPEKELPPQVQLSAEFIGKAILIKWKLPITETNNDIAYKWVLQRDIDKRGFIDIANGERDPNNKRLEQGQEVNYFLDKVISRDSTYSYKMFFVSVDGVDTTESQATVEITILKDEQILYVAVGKPVETTRPLLPYKSPPKVLFEWPELFKDVSATFSGTAGLQPLITSSLNPQDEPYLFALTPIPSPDPSSECSHILEILYMVSADGGQAVEVFATILEDQTLVRNQNLFEIIPSDTRIYNDMYHIEMLDQTIVDYENLEVQLDIDGEVELDPNNYRQLSIYEVNLYVPEGNAAC